VFFQAMPGFREVVAEVFVFRSGGSRVKSITVTCISVFFTAFDGSEEFKDDRP